MRPKLPHSVVRQVLEVDMIGTEADAMALQGALAPLCREALLPVIEQAFDRCAPEHRMIRIDRLDLDLGSVTLASLERELPALLGRCLDAALEAHTTGGAETSDGTSSSTELAHALDDALAHFLRYGTLPPAFHLAAGSDFEATLLAFWHEAGQATPAPPSHALRAALQEARARERLAGQFTPAFQRTLLGRVATELGAAFDAALRHIASQGPAADRPPAAVVVAIERLLLRAAFARAGQARCHFDELIEDARALAPGNSAVQAALANSALRPGAENTKPPVELVTLRGQQLGLGAPPAAHPDQSEGIFVDNAGLVLLHPFLPRMFETLAFARGKELVAPGRAIALLHHLATGQTAAPEYALALPKLLCALPLTDNVEAGVVLTEDEKNEARELLEAVISHWYVLKNTSPDALRGTFLMRPGKLSERDGEWLLQLETHAADILMGQLPWGVSAIRLPWMKSMLWVEWA
ncbi:MAG: contractile injection system tape measure protein [Pseudomonadota bacterium]